MMVLNLEDDERLIARYIIDRAICDARAQVVPNPEIDAHAITVLESLATKITVALSRPHVTACWLNTLHALESGLTPRIYDAALSLGKALGLDHLCVPATPLQMAVAIPEGPTTYDLRLDPVAAAELRAAMHTDRKVVSVDPDDVLMARVEIRAGGAHAYICEHDLLGDTMWVCLDGAVRASNILLSMLVTKLERQAEPPSAVDNEGTRHITLSIP